MNQRMPVLVRFISYIFNFKQIAELCELPNGFMIGAGAGPAHVIGVNSEGYDLWDEHWHCFSTHGQGGHYDWDTTPDHVEYRGYFVLAEYLYRIDQPTKPNT